MFIKNEIHSFEQLVIFSKSEKYGQRSYFDHKFLPNKSTALLFGKSLFNNTKW